ncbi:MAG: hypothetical protein IPN13_08820 [Bacteroidetes bacterium]|nr:hypothetical protein [Bacteroidota bacterium]
MALKRSTFVILFFCLLGGSVFAQQQKQPDIFKDADGNTYHQLFLDFEATELLKLNYTLDEAPVDGVLSTDGYSIIIKNYPGDKSVKALIKDESGAEKEITKSRCFIDPIILQL